MFAKPLLHMLHLCREIVAGLDPLRVVDAGVLADSEVASESDRSWSKLLAVDDVGVMPPIANDVGLSGNQASVQARNELMSS